MLGWAGALIFTFSLAVAQSTPNVQFTDITAQSHIDFTLQNSATSSKYLIETMAGGVAIFDFDNDGRLDIFFTNGALIFDPMPDGKLPDKSDKKFWNHLNRKTPAAPSTDETAREG